VGHELPAVGTQPFAAAIHARQSPLDGFPEGIGVIHLDEMSNLVRGDVVENERRRHDEPPVEVEPAVGRARDPARRLAAERDGFDLNVEALGMDGDAALQILVRFELEPVGEAPRAMRRIARHCEQNLAVLLVGLDMAAHGTGRDDAVLDTPYGDADAGAKGHGLDRPLHPCAEPVGLTIKEIGGLPPVAEAWHGKQGSPGMRERKSIVFRPLADANDHDDGLSVDEEARLRRPFLL
jgi:hypothetical protein